MPLKYADAMSGIANCPPASIAPCERECFRFVRAKIDDPKNFLPVARLQPQRRFDSDEETCISHALSLFVSRDTAVAKYKTLKRFVKNIKKTIGSHLAAGIVDNNDGSSSRVNNEGHFSLFESDSCDLSVKFQITEELS